MHPQGQKREQRHTAKNFVEFHNHSPLLTIIFECTLKDTLRATNRGFSSLKPWFILISEITIISDLFHMEVLPTQVLWLVTWIEHQSSLHINARFIHAGKKTKIYDHHCEVAFIYDFILHLIDEGNDERKRVNMCMATLADVVGSNSLLLVALLGWGSWRICKREEESMNTHVCAVSFYQADVSTLSFKQATINPHR